MCSDLLKVSSDDSFYTTAHIMYLAEKYRGLLLEQKYKNSFDEIPTANYQTLCLDLQQTTTMDGNPCGAVLLKSTEQIPSLLSEGCVNVYPPDYLAGSITLVSKKRLKYVGNNPWLQNIIYAAITPDKYLYLKSANPQFLHLEKIRMTGLFDNIGKAADMACSDSDAPCDKMGMEFPLEETLIPSLIEGITKFMSSGLYKPEDITNDASDDLSSLAAFLRTNMKSNFRKQTGV